MAGGKRKSAPEPDVEFDENGEELASAAEVPRLPGENLAAWKRRRKKKTRKLKKRIKALEAEIAAVRVAKEAAEAALSYELTDDTETAVREAVKSGDTKRLSDLVSDLHPADFADLLERQSPAGRDLIIEAAGEDFDPEVIPHLDEAVRETVVATLELEVLADAVSKLDSDDALELIEDLDEAEKAQVLEAIPEEERVLVEQGLTFAEGTAGRLMQREIVVVPEHWDVGQTIDYLRSMSAAPDDFYDLYVVDTRYRPIGKIPLSLLLRNKRPIPVVDIMSTGFHKVPADMDQEEVAMLFRRYGLVSAPVIDEGEWLLGAITVDDVVDVIDEEAEEDLLRLGGVTSDDLHGNLVETTRSRFIWLAVNLMTAIVASAVIGVFETTIEKIVALAILMPIVASMGGNAGTQTLTVAVRALAMRDLSPTNAAKFVVKETMVGWLNGMAFALIAGAVTWAWFGDSDIAVVLAVSMIINLVIAGLCGTLIPISLDKINIDPAVASTVFLTTVTDVVGFFTFLGLAAVFLI